MSDFYLNLVLAIRCKSEHNVDCHMTKTFSWQYPYELHNDYL